MNYDELNALKATRDHERRVEECISSAAEFCNWYRTTQRAIRDAGLLAQFKAWRKNVAWLLSARGFWVTLVPAGSQPNTPPVRIAALTKNPWRPLVNPVFVYWQRTGEIEFFNSEKHTPRLVKRA